MIPSPKTRCKPPLILNLPGFPIPRKTNKRLRDIKSSSCLAMCPSVFFGWFSPSVARRLEEARLTLWGEEFVIVGLAPNDLPFFITGGSNSWKTDTGNMWRTLRTCQQKSICIATIFFIFLYFWRGIEPRTNETKVYPIYPVGIVLFDMPYQHRIFPWISSAMFQGQSEEAVLHQCWWWTTVKPSGNRRVR